MDRVPAYFQPEGSAHGAKRTHQGAPRPAGHVPGAAGRGDLRFAPDNLQLGNRPHLPRCAEPTAPEQSLQSKCRLVDQRRCEGNEVGYH